MTQKKRMIVGISGATGIIYGIRILEVLRRHNIETHLVVSKAAEMTLHYETDYSIKELRQLADINYGIQDVGAAISSGSFHTMGMVIAPCPLRLCPRSPMVSPITYSHVQLMSS